MVIVIDDFRIKNAEAGNCKFDLHEVKTIKSGAREGETVEVPVAYGITFERVAQIIVHNRIQEDVSEVEITEFLEVYKETAKWLIEELKKLK